MSSAEKDIIWGAAFDAGNLYRYLSAPYGARFGVYAGGAVLVGGDVGNEIAEDERPLVWVNCPGIGNLDMSWYREGLEGEECMTDEQVLQESCDNGDVHTDMVWLGDKLLEAYVDTVLRRRTEG